MYDRYYCDWYGIPLSCIECPIRHVEISCKLNTDCGDWKFWDRRRKKWPICRNKILNRGLLMELCRRSNCNPEFLKYLLIAIDCSADKCVCKHVEPWQKNNATIPLTKDSTYLDGVEINKCEYKNRDCLPHLYKNPCNVQKSKSSEKMSTEWLDNLSELYNLTVGKSPDDELECLVTELQQRNVEFFNTNQFNENGNSQQRYGDFLNTNQLNEKGNNHDTNKEQIRKNKRERKRHGKTQEHIEKFLINKIVQKIEIESFHKISKPWKRKSERINMRSSMRPKIIIIPPYPTAYNQIRASKKKNV